jgi:ribonuclease P protein component
VDRGAIGSATERPALTFSARDRLRKRFEFRHVRDVGLRVHTRSFVVLLAHRREATSRLGLTVSRQVGHAVRRNRIKRLLRELFRTHRALFPAAADIVVIAKTGCAVQGFDDVLHELERASSALQAAARRLSREGASGAR